MRSTAFTLLSGLTGLASATLNLLDAPVLNAAVPSAAVQNAAVQNSVSVVFSHQVVTVTHCAASVTDCPAESQHVQVVTSIIPETSTFCPEAAAATVIPSPPPSNVNANANNTPCSSAVCVVTVTLPKSLSPVATSSATQLTPYYPVAANASVATAFGTGTTASVPSASYLYSNTASNIKCGSLALGAGVVVLASALLAM